MATEKKIFKDIIYIGQKILEAIKGHNDDAEAHPTISKQIKVLSNSKADKNNATFTGTMKLNNKDVATTDDAMIRYGSASTDILTNANYRKPYTTTITSYTAESLGLSFEYYNIIYQPNIDANGYGTQIAIQFNSGKIFTRASTGLIWNKWKEITITEKIDISSYLVGQWKKKDYYQSFLVKVGNIVTGTISVKGGATSYATPIMTLPEGWRPVGGNADVIGNSYNSASSQYENARFYIQSDGTVAVSKASTNEITMIFAYCVG